MSQYVTTHNDQGQSIFSKAVPQEPHAHGIPGGKMEIIYAMHDIPADLSTEQDTEQFNHDRVDGLPGGALCPPKGAAAALVSFEPNAASVMHRTMTLDTIVLVEGVLECHLDSGEVVTLRVGDSIVQRGTMHQWRNVTPNQGWARIAGA